MCLEYSLRQSQTRYPFIALYTDSVPAAAHRALALRNIATVRVDRLTPPAQKDFSSTDVRFFETWTKLTVFGLTDYDRLVLFDSDMTVQRNVDELMDLPLDGPADRGRGSRVFAASHACACNPLKKPHYPSTWSETLEQSFCFLGGNEKADECIRVPENCAFTKQHADPDTAQTEGAPCSTGVGMLNSGMLVVVPSADTYNMILSHLATDAAVAHYSFPDQELLSQVFRERWVPLPYVYNALKTLRTTGIHDAIWRDDRVKVVHYILTPKPWAEDVAGPVGHETHNWWRTWNAERLLDEKARGIVAEGSIEVHD